MKPLKTKMTVVDFSAVRDLSHEATQRISEWQARDRQIKAGLSDIKQDLERFFSNQSVSADPKVIQKA